MKPNGNPRFLFPGQQAAPQNPENSQDKPIEKPQNSVKSDLELKRELLRKKKEELEKKLEKKVAEPPKIIDSHPNEENKTSESPSKIANINVPALSNSELLKKKREELERKKKLGEQAAPLQAENSSKLEELKKKYMKPTNPEPMNNSSNSNSLSPNPNPLNQVNKPVETMNKLDELKKKYQNNNTLTVNRASEPLYRTGMGKSVSTSHVACESKTFKFPGVSTQIQDINNPQEEEKQSNIIDNKEDFLKRMEMIQAGLDKKLDKMKVEEKDNPLIVVSTKSVDLGQPSGINLNQYRSGLKKNLLSINPEAEKLMNMPKKILTPSGMRIHSTLAERVAGLEALFGPSSGNNGTEEMKPELKKKIEEEIEICLKLYHLSLERPELPEKRQKPKRLLMKRQSKEWN